MARPIQGPKLAAFATWLRQQGGLGERTIAQYLTTARRLLRDLGPTPDAAVVDAYAQALLSKSPTTYGLLATVYGQLMSFSEHRHWRAWPAWPKTVRKAKRKAMTAPAEIPEEIVIALAQIMARSTLRVPDLILAARFQCHVFHQNSTALIRLPYQQFDVQPPGHEALQKVLDWGLTRLPGRKHDPTAPLIPGRDGKPLSRATVDRAIKRMGRSPRTIIAERRQRYIVEYVEAKEKLKELAKREQRGPRKTTE